MSHLWISVSASSSSPGGGGSTPCADWSGGMSRSEGRQLSPSKRSSTVTRM